MTKTADAAASFLSHRRIAVTGVSRDPANHGGNIVYTRLRERGYDVAAVNPNAETVEGDPCYPNLHSVPGSVEAVVIATSAQHADATMHEAVDMGISDVWMHRSFGPGSVSDNATAYGREHGVTVIDGGCPLMYGPTSDGGHRFMCRLLTWTGKVPRTV
jgi:predicted CoA-binding protein